MIPRICILRTDGTNCDVETEHAFRLAGGVSDFIHVNQLRDGSKRLADYQILALSGGFSYGDDIASGKVLANELVSRLRDQMQAFVEAGNLVIGICNGFQILVRTGLLPFPTLGDMHATLAHNASGHFQCEWVELEVEESPCLFTQGLPDRIELQMAHGEGRFFAADQVLDRLEEAHLVALRYAVNPNGSANGIAGLCDPTGRIFGLMPHPERFVRPTQHPNWRRDDAPPPFGLAIFQNAVRHAAAS